MDAALKVVKGIIDHASRAVANKEDCKRLASFAAQTEPFLQTLEQHPVNDPSVRTALDVLYAALNEVDGVIEKCCKSTCFTAAVCAWNNSEMLTRAAQRLEHALQQVPLAILCDTRDILETMQALREDMRQAKFDSMAASTHQTQVLKEEMEKAFNKHLKMTEEVKSIIDNVMKEHSRSTDAKLKDLLVLMGYMNEAREDKNRQHEFELQMIIDVISDSIKLNAAASSSNLAEALLDQLCCPISKMVMKDPVVLKDSGMTYERDSIVKWLGKGHRTDPICRTEIRSGELIPNHLAKSMVYSTFKIEGSTNRQTEKEEKQPLEGGLYEGHGQHKRADGTVESAYLLICRDPDGNVQGCLITEAEDSDNEHQFLILRGEWDAFNRRLLFADEQFMYDGTLSEAASGQMAFRFVGNTRPFKDSFFSSSFEYLQLMPPPLQYSLVFRSGLLEMEGIIVGTNEQEYQSKMVLSLMKDSGLRGWLSIETSAGSIRVGNVLSGGWKLNGDMHLFLYFPRSANEPLDSISSPSNFLAKYKLEGSLRVGDSTGNRQSTAFEGVWRLLAGREDNTIDATNLTMIRCLESYGGYNYHCFRTPSRRLSPLLQNFIRPLLFPNEPGNCTEFSRFLCLISMPQFASSIQEKKDSARWVIDFSLRL